MLERKVIYSYIALGGFLWALWAVYKASLGEEFGKYTLIMYRYAKKYYKKVCFVVRKNVTIFHWLHAIIRIYEIRRTV